MRLAFFSASWRAMSSIFFASRALSRRTVSRISSIKLRRASSPLIPATACKRALRSSTSFTALRLSSVVFTRSVSTSASRRESASSALRVQLLFFRDDLFALLRALFALGNEQLGLGGFASNFFARLFDDAHRAFAKLHGGFFSSYFRDSPSVVRDAPKPLRPRCACCRFWFGPQRARSRV